MTPSLFAWQRALIASGLPEAIALTGLRIGLDSAQTTGREVVINSALVAADVGCSERTVWRRVQDLVAAGWMLQTAKPTYTGGESKGRRARYVLLIPALSCDTSPEDLAHDPQGVACHESPSGVTRPAGSPDTTPPDLSHDTPSRVTKQAQSSAMTTVTGGTLSASDGSSNSSSRSGDVAIEILASKLRQTTALAGLRTDKLKPAQASRLVELIEQHGDTRLVDQALLGLRRDNPPQTIQAFLPGWENIPPAGQHLALVKDPPCPERGHSGTTKHCIECASEKIASDR